MVGLCGEEICRVPLDEVVGEQLPLNPDLYKLAYHETEACKKAMRKRQVWIEPLFGEAKQWHGMERMRLRTLERANCEVLITASGQNVKRLLKFGGHEPRRSAQVAALRPPTRAPHHADRHRHEGCSRSLAWYHGVSQQAAAF